MSILRKIGRYLVKQVLGIMIAAGIIVGTVIAMVLSALMVALFGLFASFFFALSPIFGIVLRKKLKGWSSAADELIGKLNEFTASANAASSEREREANVHPFRKKP